MTRLATDNNASSLIAQDGMFLLMKAVAANIEDTEILVIIFELFGELAFIKSNLAYIIQV